MHKDGRLNVCKMCSKIVRDEKFSKPEEAKKRRDYRKKWIEDRMAKDPTYNAKVLKRQAELYQKRMSDPAKRKAWNARCLAYIHDRKKNHGVE